ncbi:MAG: hypothetical protein GX286_04185 [Clostridiales bacterium]|nr:hypothetical protein [Clostridiales bacterium]
MMLKLIGVMLLVCATGYTGLSMSASLKERIRRLELIRKMVDEITILIRHRALTVMEIIDELTANSSYAELTFLHKAKSGIIPEVSFHYAWENAVKKDNKLLNEEKTELISLGNFLGSSDTEGQISALTIYKDKFNSLIEYANEIYDKKGKLYRSLGVLSGVFVAILLV